MPPTEHAELHVPAAGCAHGSPTVTYRGIFLNDEEPALKNWAMEKFTNGTGAALTGSPFNRRFYAKLCVFDSESSARQARQSGACRGVVLMLMPGLGCVCCAGLSLFCV